MLNSAVWNDPNSATFKVWVYCILQTNYHDSTVSRAGEEITIKPGQFIYSRNSWAEELNIAPSTIRNIINKLQKWCMIEDIRKDKHRFTVFQVKNWDKYQSEDNQMDMEKDSRRTAGGQPEDISKNKEIINSSTNVEHINVPEGTLVTPKGKNLEVQEVVDYWKEKTSAIKVSAQDRRAVYNLLRNKALQEQNPTRAPVQIAKSVIDVAVEAQNWSGSPFPPGVSTLSELYAKIDALKTWYIAKEKRKP